MRTVLIYINGARGATLLLILRFNSPDDLLHIMPAVADRYGEIIPTSNPHPPRHLFSSLLGGGERLLGGE